MHIQAKTTAFARFKDKSIDFGSEGVDGDTETFLSKLEAEVTTVFEGEKIKCIETQRKGCNMIIKQHVD